MFIHSDRLSSTSISDDFKTKEDIEEEDFEPIPEVDIDGVILESHSDPRDPVAKNSKKLMLQQLNITATLRTNRMVDNFTQEINY